MDEVGSLSRRDRTQRPKTASNTSASGGRNNRRVSIMEKKESKGSGQHSTDSSGLSSISSVLMKIYHETYLNRQWSGTLRLNMFRHQKVEMAQLYSLVHDKILVVNG